MAQWGEHLKLTVFGESHGPLVGMTLDNVPAGITIDPEALASLMARRRPGQGVHTTQRVETDTPQYVSGLKDFVTTGAPITVLLTNSDTRSKDYGNLVNHPRPSHCDWPAHLKWAGFEDARGGGTFSARLTAPVTLAGGIAMQALKTVGVSVHAQLLQVGRIEGRRFHPMGEDIDKLNRLHHRRLAVMSDELETQMLAEIEAARRDLDSVGGVIELIIQGLPAGLGGAMFEGMESVLAQLLMGIPGVRGVEFGEGFGAAQMRGSQHNDVWTLTKIGVRPATNHAGGVVAGITTGLPLIARVAFKPTASIAKPQLSLNTATQQMEPLVIKGRHDPAIVARAAPIVEAVGALAVLDQTLAAPTLWSDVTARFKERT